MAYPLTSHINHLQEQLPICGMEFCAHPSGALIWPSEDTLIVSDLYLRSGYTWSAMMQLGHKTQASEIILAIKNLVETYSIRQVIAVGRPFRRLDDPYHIGGEDLTILYNMQKHLDWIWVAGSMSRQLPSQVGGIRASKYEHNGFTFRAKPRSVPVSHEIAGGMYPMARITEGDHEISHPCFVSNGKRLIMPAFGGKLSAHNILGDEFLPFFGYDELMIQAVDQYRTFPVPRHTLSAG